MEILSINNLNFRYPQCEQKSLDNINLTVNEGEFITICGESGCGKTTLLKMIKKELTPHGERSGELRYKNTLIDELDRKISASQIGFVLQNPDTQIVTDKVWHELAFGLENLGVEPNVIKRQVGEMSSYFGINEWFRDDVNKLSGGQKQLLNLASVMAMQPQILLLDEPTSQLDPIASSDFIATLHKLNKELGLTIIIVEHNLEEVFSISDKVLVMAKGRISAFDKPNNIVNSLKKVNQDNKMLKSMPTSVRIFEGLGKGDNCPLDVKGAKRILKSTFKNDIKVYKYNRYIHKENVAIKAKDVWFRYDRNSKNILKGLNLEVFESEVFSILGGNGSGKTTILNILCGLEKSYKGKINLNSTKNVNGKGSSIYRHNIAYLPQNPTAVFVRNSVKEDLLDIVVNENVDKKESEKQIVEISQKLDVTNLLSKNPFDLSGGELQKCAIAKLLLLKPKIILLDEPTKGYDVYAKEEFAKILNNLKGQGVTVIIVTHDVEFASKVSDRCGLLFDGELMGVDVPTKFFSNNYFYTTVASRISRGHYENTITCQQIISMCNENGEKDG